MAAVTYLIGAGASFERLPLVKDMAERLEAYRVAFMNYQSPNAEQIDDRFQMKKDELKQEIDNHLRKLILNIKEHASIDTYARKLHHQNDWFYMILKVLLTFHFAYEQIKTPDRRYDAFFASIINDYGPGRFLDVRVLSWNYDSQFELSWSQFSKTKSLQEIQQHLNVIPRNNEVREIETDKFGIFKLNGYGVFRTVNSMNDFYYPIDDVSKISREQLFENLYPFYFSYRNEMYSKQNNKERPVIGFAWEDFTLSRSVLTQAIKGMENTKALVIVGYSFPFFNRNVDREIFFALNKDAKIYVQDTQCAQVLVNLKSVLPDRKFHELNIIPVPIVPPNDPLQVVQFFMPPEL